jgi:hypothetical protein
MTEIMNVNGIPEVLNLPFPTATKQAAGVVDGVLTDVMCVTFSDKILVTISQRGRLAHWVGNAFWTGNSKFSANDNAKVTCTNGEYQPRY